MSRVFFEFSIPTIGMIFLVVASALGWNKQKNKIEEARRYRAMQHSSARAQIVTAHPSAAETIAITGVMRMHDTVLVGYRKSFPNQGALVPGEKVDIGGVVTGTWVAWLQGSDNADIDTLDAWCKDKVEVVLRIEPGSLKLFFVEPLSAARAKLQLAPS